MFQLMRLQFVIILLFCCISLMGQTIRGLVVNSNKECISYANVVLVAKTDSAYVAGTVTTEEGEFSLSSASESDIKKRKS